MVRAGHEGEEPPSEPIAVDHDVEGEEEGAQPVRHRAKDAYRGGERRRDILIAALQAVVDSIASLWVAVK